MQRGQHQSIRVCCVPMLVQHVRDQIGAHARRIAISSTKSMHAHALGAAGALEAAATALIARIDDMGGAVAAIEEGFQKSEIERSAYQFALEIDSGERTVVGVNKFTVDDKEKYDQLRVNPAIEAEQGELLATLRASRDNAAVDRYLEAIRVAARGTDNLLYPMRDALRAKATVGEVSNALRDVWGQYVPRDAF